MARFTRKAIIQTFREMLVDSPFDKITVTDIIEKCGINRNTFYYYFRDIFDLLESFLKEELEKVLDDNENDSWENMFKRIMNIVTENRNIVYHIFNSLNRDQLERYMFEFTEKRMFEFVKIEADGLNVVDEDIRYISEFYRYILIGFFLKYIWNDMKPSANESIDQLSAIFNGTIRHCLENCSNKNKALPKNPTNE